ncbi:MAG: outer membrane beta-barrel protein [Bacteroidales bacterium]|nr:outer membrane beta-barrel protein [Bacteroidales bacterium]MBN2756725.1 outer membrane beta-barrel protein [Bacteroidales bacterium]
MKRILLITLGLFWGMTIFSQEKDTTKIKLGDTKIIIIEKAKKNKDKEEKLKNLESGLKDFEQLLKEKEEQLATQAKLFEEIEKKVEEEQEEELKIQQELLLKQEDTKMKELEKEVEALEKGIDDIQAKIEDWNENDEIEEKDENDVYDWDWEKEWPRDWNNISPFGKNKKFKGHWAGFELGLNNYVNKNYSTVLDGDDALFELNPEISWSFSLNFMEFNIPFGKGVGLTTGMGTTWNNYHFRNNVNIFENDLNVISAEIDTINSYSKNSINLWYLTIPLIFEFQIPVAQERPGIHVGMGVVGSLKLSSKRKAEYSDNINEYEIKNKSDFQIPALKYGLTFRIGYKFISLYAIYDMVPLFNKDRGPEVYPISVGIVLLDF